MNFFNIALDIFIYVFLKTDPNILTMVASALYMVAFMVISNESVNCG